MNRRPVALLLSAAVALASTGACTAQKNTKKPGYTLSGPGPEILVGGLAVIAGGSLVHRAGTSSPNDQFRLADGVTLIGLGVIVLGVVLIGHGIYRLTRPAKAPPPGPLALAPAPADEPRFVPTLPGAR